MFSPFPAEWVLRALIDFTLSNARRFYSSMGNPLDGKGLEPKNVRTLGKLSPAKARARWPTCEEWELLFSPKRGWWPIIFFAWFNSLTPPLCAVTLKKKINGRKKSYWEKCIRSHHSWTQNCLLGITFPRNISKQCLFMSCAGVIKQTLN